jgi:hypothetical protein
METPSQPLRTSSVDEVFRLVEAAIEKGDLSEMDRIASDFRLRTEIRGALAPMRIQIALRCAEAWWAFEALPMPDRFERAFAWALRALLDGPEPAAFDRLAEIAGKGDIPEEVSVWQVAAAAARATSPARG